MSSCFALKGGRYYRSANYANTARKECDCSEYDSNYAEHETCGSNSGGLTCGFELFTAVYAKYESDDGNGKTEKRKISAEYSEYDTNYSKYKTCDCGTLAVLGGGRHIVIVHYISPFLLIY